jgi:hypothetical protein
MNLYKILLILATIALICSICICNKNDIENFVSYYSDDGVPSTLLEQVMKERGMNEDAANYDYYIPSNYDTCEADAKKLVGTSGKKMFLLDGCDMIASKMALWALIKEYHGKDATKYMPATYLLEEAKDLNEFPSHYKNNKNKRPDQMYVLKNYEQRQEGIKLTRNLDDVMNGLKDGWFLAQDYLYDPYLISNHKINFRYYMLIVCANNNISAYIHKDGFLYYTPKHYDENDMDFNKHITTGYIDRKIYEENPLTLQDFRDYLEKKQKGSSKYWDKQVENMFHNVMKAIKPKICNNKGLNNNVRFQIFGCDVAPSSNLEARLMEINKGPDLDAKDERDKNVKLTMQRDIFKIIDPSTPDEKMNTRFVKIY